MDEKPWATGFVSLKSVKQGAPDAASALAEIRRIYFKTTRKTIEHDLAHAIELLKSLPTEEDREKAAVFMEGLAQMRREWGGGQRPPRKRERPRANSSATAASHGGTGKRGRPKKNRKAQG